MEGKELNPNLLDLINQAVLRTVRELNSNVDREYQHHPGVSTKAAAEILGVHEQTVRAYIKQGKIRARGVGAYRLDMRDILRLNREVGR